MEYLYQAEAQDCVRFSWNIFPSTNVECKKLMSTSPLGCMYTPIKYTPTCPTVNYAPLKCSRCSAYINPYCEVNVDTPRKTWSCCFCSQGNAFPQGYDGINSVNLPAELHGSSTTIDYILPSHVNEPPVFLFVVDICLKPADFENLVNSIIEAIGLLPKNSYVGLITFGSLVHVYELGFTHLPKTVIFDGNKPVTSEIVQHSLDIGTKSAGGKIEPNYQNNYILPVEVIEDHLKTILQSLYQDPKPTPQSSRPLLATGVAVAVALHLLEYTFPNSGARVMIFNGGPCTQGPGTVVGLDKKEEAMRSFHQLNKESAKHTHKARKFYEQLSTLAVSHGHAVDIYSCSLNQTGILEMQSLVKETGGLLFTCHGFGDVQFINSFRKSFTVNQNGELNMAFNAIIELSVSDTLAVCGGIGHMASMDRRTTNVSETEIGIGRTSVWKASFLDNLSTFAFYFEVVNPRDRGTPEKPAMIQFKTSYYTPSGQRIFRITTVAHSWVDTSSRPGIDAILTGFDQEACAALVARLVVYKAEKEETNIIRWLDQHLIAFTKRYAIYNPGDEYSFQLPESIAVYPQFMFHLRRGPLVSIFGQSPDEVVYHRYYLLRETTGNVITMIQPSLDSYTFDLYVLNMRIIIYFPGNLHQYCSLHQVCYRIEFSYWIHISK
eukprot:TRINITY_DN4406_c0_g3_i1.p1 TRINITY_DN4406_c0_g3~~TRINITY_DN4406_c0_g3_i1.p1  ORF type:complete len:662 (-),score=131.45 TRINITY_DN4406_c0_g3_i1:945-2930(-)